jgi:hypothetical protein
MKSQKKQIEVILSLALLLILQLGLVTATALAQQDIVRWRDIIGIIQAGNIVGSGAGRVTGGGQPWHTSEGKARVNRGKGHVIFEVEGLVLAGGNSIGTPNNVTQVKGTLVCDTTGSVNGDSVLVDTPLVALSEQGDAHFQGDIGPLPDVCLTVPNIAFLIRTGGGAWIASGAVRKP